MTIDDNGGSVGGSFCGVDVGSLEHARDRIIMPARPSPAHVAVFPRTFNIGILLRFL